MAWDTRAQILVGAWVIDLGIQLLGWTGAVLLQSEYFYDLLGSATYLTLALGSLIYGGTYHALQILMTTLVAVWALRLGTFLFTRVIKAGGDSRFHELKTKPLSFLVAWVLQAIWVFVCSSPLLLLNSAEEDEDPGIDPLTIIGVILWAIGFLTETIADAQKFTFKLNPANRGKFINTGLWTYARYPNYFGEMCVWWGIWLGCAPTFKGGEWACVVSPLFVMFLLLFVSGIPLQEAQAQTRWGSDAAYQEYKANTTLLIPLPLKWGACTKKNDSE